jgi:hypothetical protein
MTRIGEKRNAYKVLVDGPREGHLGVDGKIILKLPFKK